MQYAQSMYCLLFGRINAKCKHRQPEWVSKAPIPKVDEFTLISQRVYTFVGKLNRVYKPSIVAQGQGLLHSFL